MTSTTTWVSIIIIVVALPIIFSRIYLDIVVNGFRQNPLDRARKLTTTRRDASSSSEVFHYCCCRSVQVRSITHRGIGLCDCLGLIDLRCLIWVLISWSRAFIFVLRSSLHDSQRRPLSRDEYDDADSRSRWSDKLSENFRFRGIVVGRMNLSQHLHNIIIIK